MPELSKDQMRQMLIAHLDNLIEYAFDFNSQAVKMLAKDENNNIMAAFIFTMGEMAPEIVKAVERIENAGTNTSV